MSGINQVWDYVEGNFRVFALWGIKDGKCECRDPECIAVGKHPRVSSWQKTPYQDDEQIENMQQYLVETGYGVCLDHHLVIDIDPRNGGVESFERLQSDLGMDLKEASGCVVATGGGGHHVYFTIPADVKLMTHHKEYLGIDFKGAGGFVVGAGSLHASGMAYEFEKGNPSDLTQCPAPLIELLRRVEHKNKSYEGEEVTDTEIKTILDHITNDDVHYDDWIKVGMAIHDATNGQGFALWDEWSMKSTKYNPAMMEQRWHSFGKSANPVRVGTLFHMAEREGYIRPVTFDSPTPYPETEEQGEAEAATTKPKHVRMLEALQANDDAEMARIANMAWLIDGLIPAESFGVLYGEPGCGKSFTAVDMACSIASGNQWQGLDTGDEGVVVYISAEGGNGMRFRKRAWEQVNTKAPLMRVLPITTIMDDPKDVGQLTQVIREYRKSIKQPIKMVIVDTLNRSMGGNENDNSDMADFIRGCELIQHDHKCGVMVVHHSGKDAEKGARGASALKAATDFEIMVTKQESILTITNTRAKDVEPLPPIICRADVVTIEGYTDYKGRPITSLVPVPASFSDQLKAASGMTERETMLLDCVRAQVAKEGALDGSADRQEVRRLFMERSGIHGGKFGQAFSYNLKSLADKGCIRLSKDYVYLLEI